MRSPCRGPHECLASALFRGRIGGHSTDRQIPNERSKTMTEEIYELVIEAIDNGIKVIID